MTFGRRVKNRLKQFASNFGFYSGANLSPSRIAVYGSMGDFHVERLFNGAQVLIQRAAQMGQALVVERCEGMAQDHFQTWRSGWSEAGIGHCNGNPAPSSSMHRIIWHHGARRA